MIVATRLAGTDLGRDTDPHHTGRLCRIRLLRQFLGGVFDGNATPA
jgi:hypothetical protein